MAKTEVILCDKCKKVVKEYNCDICGADLCNNCKSYSRLNFDDNRLLEIYFCNDCSSKVTMFFRNSKQKDEFIKNLPTIFRTEMISLLKKNLMLKNLDDEKDT